MTVAAATGLVFCFGVPSAHAAPTSDGRGYVDSTARCASADATVLFGSTDNSRVAICEVSDGEYQYRGVRLRDGARLIVGADRSDDGSFVAENAGIEYLVTSKSLVLSAGERVIREESMVDFHGPGAPAAEETPAPSTPLPPPLAAEVGGSGSADG
ncbi:hypothetical protein ABQF30_13390 [Mycolicibacterium sp. XJ870]